jgi:hypothetical protein
MLVEIAWSRFVRNHRLVGKLRQGYYDIAPGQPHASGCYRKPRDAAHS